MCQELYFFPDDVITPYLELFPEYWASRVTSKHVENVIPGETWIL